MVVWGGGVLLQHFSIGESLRILRLKISKIRTLFRTTPALNFITIFRTRDKLACEQQTHFRYAVVASLPPKNSYFSEGEKRRREMRLLFAG